MDTNSLIEHLDGWVLNCLEEELSHDQAWQKLASVAQSSKGVCLYSVNDICQLKGTRQSPSSAVVQTLIKHGVTLDGLLKLLSAAQLSHLHSILAPKEAASIITQPSPRLLGAYLGCPVTISIEVRGNPAPSLLWYKGEVPLMHQTKNKLEIQHFGPQDEGIYLCLIRQVVVTNDCYSSEDDESSTEDTDGQGVTIWSQPVEIYMKETAPEFTLQPKDDVVDCGEEITLKVECSTAYPPPKFSWYKDKQLITITDDNQFTIAKADASNSGEYVCVAINSVSLCTSEAAVINVQNEKSAQNTLQITRQPQINSSFVSRGTPLQLWCSVRSSKSVTFNWYKCGELICYSDSTILIQSEDNDIHNCSLLYIPAEEDLSTLRFICVVSDDIYRVTSREVIISLSNSQRNVAGGVIYNAQRKWALLVGNTKYGGKPLNTTISDCQRLSAKLTELGYKCLVLADLTLSHFRNAITFLASFVRQGDYVMFYYGGHGYHEGGDKIIPVDANLGEQGMEGGGDTSCLSPLFVRNTILKSLPALLFIVLDMCRTTLPTDFPSAQQPVASILPDAARCSVVLHATSIHCAALEAPSSTSVLTRHLLRRLQTHASEPLTLLASKVLQDVCGETQKVRQQQYPLLEADLALPRTLGDASTAVSGTIDRQWMENLSLGGELTTSFINVEMGRVKLIASFECFEKTVHNIVLLTAKVVTDNLPLATAKFRITALGCDVIPFKSPDRNEIVYKIEDLQCLEAPMIVTVFIATNSLDSWKEVSLNLQYPGIAKSNIKSNNLETSNCVRLGDCDKLNV